MNTSQFPSIEKLIPHGQPMQVVDALEAWGPAGTGSVSLRLRHDAPYFEQGQFQKIWTAEIMAQSIAAVAGYEERQRPDFAPESFGYVVALEDFWVDLQIPVAPGDEFVIDVERTFDLRPAAVYCAKMRKRNGIPGTHLDFYAKATFKTYIELGGKQQ